jgi:hypothetical protein
VTDPAAREPLAHWLAYLHPLWMAVSIVWALAALRSGLALRTGRRLRRPRTGNEVRRHLRLAKPAVTLIAIGFTGGPASMFWLRGRVPFDTLHAWAGTTALALFLTAAWLGRRLERGHGRPLDAHALAALLAVLVAGVAVVAGLVLLP